MRVSGRAVHRERPGADVDAEVAEGAVDGELTGRELERGIQFRALQSRAAGSGSPAPRRRRSSPGRSGAESRRSARRPGARGSTAPTPSPPVTSRVASDTSANSIRRDAASTATVRRLDARHVDGLRVGAHARGGDGREDGRADRSEHDRAAERDGQDGDDAGGASRLGSRRHRGRGGRCGREGRGDAHERVPVCGVPPPCSRWTRAASTLRLPESSGSRSSFWKIDVMYFSTLASETNSVEAMA